MNLIGKRELARRLGWSRPRLDRRLVEDGAFPVVSRGDQSGGWQFDYPRVCEYLGWRDANAHDPTPAAARKSAKDARRSAHHSGEATARQRRDLAEAELIENKLRESRVQLIARRELAEVATPVIALIVEHLELVPARVVEILERPDLLPVVRGMVAEIASDFQRMAAPLIDPDQPMRPAGKP